MTLLCALYLITLILFAVALRKLYLRIVESMRKFNESISEPCAEIAKGVRDVRRCAKAVSDETRDFLKVEENRKELKQAISSILILGIALGISSSVKRVR